LGRSPHVRAIDKVDAFMPEPFASAASAIRPQADTARVP
jgi:hypothetical protein